MFRKHDMSQPLLRVGHTLNCSKGLAISRGTTRSGATTMYERANDLEALDMEIDLN